MALKKFKESDVVHNRLKTHPKKSFSIYNGKVYYQNRSEISGAFVASVPNAPPGFVSLYELNVDRTVSDTGVIYPFIVKGASLDNFATVSTSEFSQFPYGTTITGSYPLTASISREHFGLNQARPHVGALYNTLNYYTYLSKHYTYSSSLGDKGSQPLSLISVPSIFYGSSIKKGSVDLKYYISGSLIGELKDKNKNGELIQIGPSGSVGSGSVAGVVLYTEGFVLLTGSWALNATPRKYTGDPTNMSASSWLFYGVGAEDGIGSGNIPYVNYEMQFEGTNYIPTITLLAHAEKGEMNHSGNPTYVEYGQVDVSNSASNWFIEPEFIIKNTTQSPYSDTNASFKKTTYISKVGIYDENQNLIGIATVSKPVKKTEERDLTFKLKIDF
tara:strand:- start:1920 stop:3080 length:1161 start_codon:yes stop_codon:yes gene_type:complete